MPKAFIAALKAELDARIPLAGYDHHRINVGEMLDDAFREAGYELELHQRGFAGTSVIAVKIKPS